MNKLYLRIPANYAQAWPNGALAYALRSKEGASMREGQATLAELSSVIAKSNVMVLIAASDVTLLEITIPPIPESKLKAALPNLVEDQLMSDSSDCVLILAAKHGNSPASNKRTVAVAQRSWLQQVFSSLDALGASHIKALPAQLCLPYKSGQCSARIEKGVHDRPASLSLRFGLDSGAGILLESDQGVEDHLTTVSLLSPPGPILLELPKELLSEYKAGIEANQAWADQITVQESNWSTTIDAAKTVSFNLMAGINTAQTGRIQWQIWRWPLALATLLLLVNIIGLNSDYWSLKREAAALKLGMAQTYKVSFPKDTVVPFPLDQMKKNLEIAQRNAGQAASYDFTVLLTEFGSAWSSINSSKLPKITSVEYKDSALLVQVKGTMPQDDLKQALSLKKLNFKKLNAETWQVKGAE